MSELILKGTLCRIRPYRKDDAQQLRAVADDFLVARWMTRTFPHPYTQADADGWISLATSDKREEVFAVEVGGILVGGVGVEPYTGAHAGVAEFGYWLGRAYWGRGIATEAARMLADHALSTGQLRRLEANVYGPNTASARVLEKCGFTCEGVLRGSYVDREGVIRDGLIYGRLAE